jgi:hypothetical protein
MAECGRLLGEGRTEPVEVELAAFQAGPGVGVGVGGVDRAQETGG